MPGGRTATCGRGGPEPSNGHAWLHRRDAGRRRPPPTGDTAHPAPNGRFRPGPDGAGRRPAGVEGPIVIDTRNLPDPDVLS